MKLWKYKDYEEYKKVQIKFTNAKIKSGASWVNPYDIKGLVSYIVDYNPEVSFGLCHGTRRGVEQEEFINTFNSIGWNVTVIGSEISPEVSKEYPHTIEWDFHEVKDEWINSVDFIFSNSFDHSYDPEKALDSWMSCLNEKGLCFIEWNKGDINNREGDPFGATYEEYKEMFSLKYEVVDILENDPGQDTSWGQAQANLQRFYFVIRNLK